MTEAFEPSQSFLRDVGRITALNVFARAFPVWTRRHGKTVSVQCVGHLDGSVEINLGLPPGSSEVQANEVVELLEQCQRLADLQVIVQEMRQAGVAPAILENYIMQGEALAQKLFPPPGR